MIAGDGACRHSRQCLDSVASDMEHIARPVSSARSNQILIGAENYGTWQSLTVFLEQWYERLVGWVEESTGGAPILFRIHALHLGGGGNAAP